MPHDFSNDQSAHTSSRAAAHNQGSSGINIVPVQKKPAESIVQTVEEPRSLPEIFTPATKEKTAAFSSQPPGPFQLKNAPVQRQVIQLQWNIDEELTKANEKKEEALQQIAASRYADAVETYQEVKAFMKEIYKRFSAGTDSIFKRHTGAIDGYVREIIASFTNTLQAKVDIYTVYYRDLHIRYETRYDSLYNGIAAALYAKGDVKVLTDSLKEAGKAHLTEFGIHKDAVALISAFNATAAKDGDVLYDNGRGSESAVTKTKLATIPTASLKEYSLKNKSLYDKSKAQSGEVKKSTDQPGDDPLRENAVLLLLAGSDERKTAISQLPGIDLPKQISIFTQINKHHRSDDIAQVAAFIQATGLANLTRTLALIEAAGAKGTIEEIKKFYDYAKTVQGAPELPAMIGFLSQVPYTSMTDLAAFVKETGRHLELDAIKPVWIAAETNKNIAGVTDLFKEGVIPAGLIVNAPEIGLAFAGKKGKSVAADWSKLLNVSNWEKQHLLALALAFDTNNGNVTAERWAAVAGKDLTLKEKPDEVRAKARLDHFANEDWYDKYDTGKLSSANKAKKKYTQLLYALLGDTKLTGLGDVSFDNIQGDFLSMLIFFHRHIASFKSDTGQGFDREDTGGGKYARSNKDHPLNEQYKKLLQQGGGDVSSLLQPLNTSFLNLQNQGAASKHKGSVSEKSLGTAGYLTGDIKPATAGLPSHNLKILGDQQHIAAASGDKKKAKEALFDVKSPGGVTGASRVIDDKALTIDSLIDKQKAALSGGIKTDARYSNFHDGLLQDRGKVVTDLSSAINGITGGEKVLHAIGSEDHPSLILNVPQDKGKFCYDKRTERSTKNLVPFMATDFNAAAGQEVKITERGSFGFQRPTLADTGDSVRLWPGYAPVTSLLPGLKVLVEKLRNKGVGPAPDLANTSALLDLAIDTTRPIVHVEALKTAMRHAFIALNTKISDGATAEKKRVYDWLRTRMLIKLQQSGILLNKAASIYAPLSAATPQEKNKHFLVTADMTDKLQEYTMLYTAATLAAPVNPNQDHTQPGKFKDTGNVYEQKVLSKLGATDHRIFYLDSGEQALIVAGMLANRFQQGKDETDKNVPKSLYVNRNPYFEIGVFGGDRRSNLENDDVNGKIVHADLSPVITEGITRPKPKADTRTEVRRTWQSDAGAVVKKDVIPIIDVTNSSMDEVKSLGNMPDNFIIVESLTKHEQLGADKFIMGRLIAVSNTLGTQGRGALVKTNFLDLAQKIVGPVANNAYNPLLAQIRSNMDKALYSDNQV